MHHSGPEMVFLPDDAESDLQAFVRFWHGQVGTRHIVFNEGDVWITVRVTRDSLLARLRDGPFWTGSGGRA